MTEPRGYDRVILARDLRSDTGKSLPAGSEGQVVDVLGPGVYEVHFRVPDDGLIGGARYESAVVEDADLLGS